MKYCPRCKTTKPLEQFRNNGVKHAYCRPCQNEYNKEWYYKNRERGLRWRKNGNLKRTFGITLDEFEVMLKKQNGVCAICKTKPEEKHLAVDHCHNSNKVRALLCGNCNRGLGMFKNDIALMQKAIDYLNHWY